MTSDPIVAIILSGGAGTRLWPLSVDAMPKQFLRLFGGHSLFQDTVKRVLSCGITELMIVCNEAHDGHVRDQLTEIGAPSATILLEPIRRDSAGAIACAVAAVQSLHGPAALALVLPSDHLIADHHAFRADIERAVLAARGHLERPGRLMTFGLQPTFPSTEFGYIEFGPELDESGRVFAVSKYHEKPQRAVAEAYLASGRFCWNGGMFLFACDVFQTEATAHMPDIWLDAVAAVADRTTGSGVMRLGSEAFARMRKSSIDYALFERSDRVGVLAARFDWSDIGNWSAVYDAHARDEAGNAGIGRQIVVDGSRNLVVADGMRVVVLGVDDLVVVATKDGVFVAPRSRASEIKGLI